MNVRLLASGLGLTLTIGGIFLCRREEKRFLSTNPKNLTLAQLLYLSCRNSIQTIHAALFSPRYIQDAHFIRRVLTATCDISPSCVYDTTSRIKHGAVNDDLITKMDGHLCFTRRSFPRDPAVVTVILLEMVTQFTLGYLTLKKTMHLEGSWTFRAPSLGSVLNRDALIIPSSIIGASIVERLRNWFLEPSSAALLISVMMIKPGLVFVRAMIAVTSFLGCHAIVGMHRLEDPSSSKTSDEIVFSTVDATWDSRTHIVTERIECWATEEGLCAYLQGLEQGNGKYACFERAPTQAVPFEEKFRKVGGIDYYPLSIAKKSRIEDLMTIDVRAAYRGEMGRRELEEPGPLLVKLAENLTYRWDPNIQYPTWMMRRMKPGCQIRLYHCLGDFARLRDPSLTAARERTQNGNDGQYQVQNYELTGVGRNQDATRRLNLKRD
ncbi:hypothetical protein L218DRAFT_948340 [Marasmius fiardii PR-910]|nr:hypothetical protein L218DRAFT_948340 [Marasmius fiardii PR-910]